MALKFAVQPEIEWNTGVFDSAEFTRTVMASSQALAGVFDHALLQPDATRDQVVKLCEEAVSFGFACAIVNPAWMPLAHSVMVGSGVPIGSTLSFPLGMSLGTTKRDEALTLVKMGARELDMVLNVGQLKSGMNTVVEREIRAVAEIAHDTGTLLKVILETCLLSMEEKLRAAELAISAGADFLKTSTGFSTGGATVADVALLRGVAGNRCGVKAAGGIRTLADARAMLEAGANRLGTSASVAIFREWCS